MLDDRARATAVAAVVALAVLMAAAASATAEPWRWTAPARVYRPPRANNSGRGFGAIRCPSISVCVGFDDAGRLVSSSAPAGGARAWHELPGTLFAPNLDDYETQTMYDASCPTVSLCVVGSGASVLYSTHPLGGASAWHSTGPVSNGMNSALTCPSATLCVGSGTTSRSADIFASANPAGGRHAWKVTVRATGTDGINAISCPTVHFCLAAGDYGQNYVTTAPLGSHWKTVRGPGDQLLDIACPAVSLCVGIGQSGALLVSTRPAASGSWRRTAQLKLGFNEVVCPNAGLCVAVGSGGVAVTNDPTGGRAAWAITPANVPLTSVSCPAPTECVAVGGADVLIGTPATG